MFRPKLFDCLPGYTRATLIADLIAGITVGILALPLAMAFAIASGVKPEQGIYTAVVAGFLISALGGSRVQIGGPTGAFVVIVAGVVQKHGLEGLTLCTMMAGVILIILGASGLGSMIRYIPRPVTIGFTNGIALLIFSTQIRDFLGLKVDHVPAEFLEKMQVLGRHLGTTDAITLGVAGSSLALLILWPRLPFKRIPGPIVALVVCTVLVALFQIPVETIGSRFGGVPSGLPAFRLPAFDFGRIGELLAPATTIALLAAIESLLSAVVADGAIGDKHDSKSELIAQGVANVASPLFGGIPATGAIARTAANIRSGGQTPIAGMVHALTLVLVLVAAAPLARFVPIPALSAVLMIVAYNMGEWKELAHVFRLPKSDVTVWAATFAMTVLVDLTVAVEIGMLLAALLFIKRVTDTTEIEEATQGMARAARSVVYGKEIPDGISVYRIRGPLLFGAAEKLDAAVPTKTPPVVIVKLGAVPAIDATGLHALEQLSRRLTAQGTRLLLCDARPQPLRMFRRSGFHTVSRANLCLTLESALRRAHAILAATNKTSVSGNADDAPTDDPHPPAPTAAAVGSSAGESAP
jgi:SulP family sulfate permease